MKYDLVRVGHTRKAVGFDGSIRLVIEDSFLDDVINAEAIFVEFGFEILPFFPDRLDHNGDFIVRFDELSDKESVTKIAGKDIYLRRSEINEIPDDTASLNYETTGWIGLLLEDLKVGPVGQITSIEEYPQQLMLIVKGASKTYLIPFHEELIVSLDLDEKIVMDLPDGILDL